MARSVASRRADARAIRQRILPLAAIAALATCSEPTGPGEIIEPLPVVVSIPDESATLATVGATVTLSATVTRGFTPVPASISWWSGHDAAVRVSTAGVVLARSRGAATIYAVSDSGGIDSVRIVVSPVPATLSLPAGPLALMRGRQRAVAAVVQDSSGTVISVSRPAWAVLDTAIASVTSDGLVTAKLEGTTGITATIGALVDTVAITVTPYPRIRVTSDTILLAVGTRIWDVPGILVDSLGEGERAQVVATVIDTTIAWAATAFPIPRISDADPRPDFEGRSIGTTRVVFSAPGWRDAEAVLRVLPAQLGQSRRREQWIDFPEWAFIGPTRGGMAAYVNDALGRPVRTLAPRLVHFASSDTTVVKLLADSAFALNSEPAIVHFDVRVEGQAVVVATSPGVLPETLDVRTRQRGFYFSRFAYELVADTVGVSYRHEVRVGSRAFLATNGAEQLVTLTQARPDVVQLPATPLTLRWFEPQPTLTFIGLMPGVDTIIASAPGHAADTLVVRVVPAALRPVATPDTLGFIEMHEIAGTTDDWAGANPIVLRVTSSDTTVLASATPFVTVGATLSYGFQVLRRGVGSASFTLTDTSGHHPPLVLHPIEVRPSWLHLYAPDLPPGGAQLGVRQRRNLGVETHWWSAGGPGTLRSSDTSIVRVSAGTFPALPFGIDIESGDVPGSAWVIASGNGFVSDSIRVTVTRARLDVGAGGNLTAGNQAGATFAVTARDADGNPRITRDTLVLKVRSTNRNRLALLDSVAVIPAGSSTSGPIRYTTMQVGPVGVTVSPTIPLHPNVDAGSTGFFIVPLPQVQVRKDDTPPPD